MRSMIVMNNVLFHDIFAAVYGTIGVHQKCLGGFSGISNMDPTQLIDDIGIGFLKCFN